MIKKYFFLPSTSWTILCKPDNAQLYMWPTVVVFMARFLLFVAFLNASAAAVLDRRRISFYTCSFFFLCLFCCHFKMKVSELYSWRNIKFLTSGSENVRDKIEEKPLQFQLTNRQNQTGNTSPSSEPELQLSPEGDNANNLEHCITLVAIGNCSLGNILPTSTKSFVGLWVRLCSQPI